MLFKYFESLENYFTFICLKNKLGTFALLHKLYKQEKLFRKELAKTFLDYLETLPINKRIDQIESLLHETKINSIVTHDSRLTSQEKKCLFSANKGKKVKEMASILGLSPRTIKYHRANIVKKLEVSNLTAAVAIGIQYNNIFNCECSKMISLDSFFTKMQLVDLLPISVFWKDKQGIYLGCNIHFANALGFNSIDKIVGKTDDNLATSDLSDHYRKDDQEVIISRMPKLNIEEEQNFPDGRKLFILTNKVPLFDENNETIGVLGVYNDITRLKVAR